MREVGGRERRDMEGQVLVTGKGCPRGVGAEHWPWVVVQDGGAGNCWERGAANHLLNCHSAPLSLCLLLSPARAPGPSRPVPSSAALSHCHSPSPLGDEAPVSSSSVTAGVELSLLVDLLAPVSFSLVRLPAPSWGPCGVVVGVVGFFQLAVWAKDTSGHTVLLWLLRPCAQRPALSVASELAPGTRASTWG